MIEFLYKYYFILWNHMIFFNKVIIGFKEISLCLNFSWSDNYYFLWDHFLLLFKFIMTTYLKYLFIISCNQGKRSETNTHTISVYIRFFNLNFPKIPIFSISQWLKKCNDIYFFMYLSANFKYIFNMIDHLNYNTLCLIMFKVNFLTI